MFEGHDTTAAALTWIIYNLAIHPEIQERTRKELFDVIGDKECPSYEDLERLQYTSMVIRESLRLYPSVPLLTRRNSKEIVISGYRIPAQTEIFLVPFAVHRNIDDWGENAHVFNPENFSAENVAKRDPFAYIPFSAGNRNCIGQNFAMLEEKVILSMLLRKFNIEIVPEHPVILEPNLILRPRFGIHIRVRETELLSH